MKQSTIQKINEHLEKARKKHPEFAPGGLMQVVSIASEELGEFAQAINNFMADNCANKDNEVIKAEYEALDLIAVLIRFIEGD